MNLASENAEALRGRDAEKSPASAPPRLRDSALKETEIGLLPADWKVATIGDIAGTTSGGTPSRKRPEYFGGRLPWVKSGELNDSASIMSTEETITELGLDESNAKLFPAGTLLIALYGATAGKVGILKTEATTNQAVCALFPNENVVGEFLFYALIYRRRALLSERYGGAQANLSQRVLRIFSVPLPPLPEQRRIAAALRTIQDAIAAQDDVIAAARELKRSLMERLFTYGPGREPAPTKETEIGEIPEHWEVTQVRHVIREDLRNGHSARESDSEEGIRTLTLTAVTDNNFASENTKLTIADPAKVADLWLEPGDVLVERANTREYVGLAAMYEGSKDYAIFPDLMIRVRTHGNTMEPKFLTDFLLTPAAREYFRRNARGTAGSMPKISQRIVQDAPIPLPPMTDQKQIVDMCCVLDEKVHTEEQRKAALEELFRSTLDQLMTGQIRLNAEAQRRGDAERS